MQIIVARTFCPAVFAPSDWVANELRCALKRRGHDVEIVVSPFDPASPPLDQMLGFRLSGPCADGDAMVALHPPCHLACHRNKVIWGVGPAVRNEDLMPAGYFAAEAASSTELESLRASDRRAYAEARRVCLRSRAACAKHLSGNRTPAVFQPLPPKRMVSNTAAEPVLAARTERANPALLLIALETLASSPQALRLALFGPPPFPATQWNELLSFYRLEGRIELREASAWPDALTRVLATLDLSREPDLLGEITIDAHGCEKPAVAFDSPAALEWIREGENGVILQPDAHSAGSALAQLTFDRARALGLRGRPLLDAWGARWDHVVETLIRQ